MKERVPDLMVIRENGKCIFGDIMEDNSSDGKYNYTIKITKGKPLDGKCEITSMLRVYDPRTASVGNSIS